MAKNIINSSVFEISSHKNIGTKYFICQRHILMSKTYFYVREMEICNPPHNNEACQIKICRAWEFFLDDLIIDFFLNGDHLVF